MSDNNVYTVSHMRRMVLNDIELYKAYILIKEELTSEDLGLTLGEIEEMALEDLYAERIQESTDERLLKLWDSLYTGPDDVPLLPESPVAEKIRSMIGHYGWRSFAKGLVEYLENKRRELKGCGLQNRAETWEKLRDHIKLTTKRRVVD